MEKVQTSRQILFNNSAEFLRAVEQDAPLGSHVSLFPAWEADIRHLSHEAEVHSEVLEAVLEFRKDLHAAVGVVGVEEAEAEAKDDWKWLLSAEQVEQRTAEWYAETAHCVTASEISALWKGPRTRASLVMSKVSPKEVIKTSSRLAVLREHTGPMDWGVRYEPVVKQVLERQFGCHIQDLGRIRHRVHNRLAASPDGLFVDGPYVGTLVEIKCPPSRVIKEEIPFDYWCQMQIQMEVCDRPSCEYVEAKFREVLTPSPVEGTATQEKPLATGWITLEHNTETDENRYKYHDTEKESECECEGVQINWIHLETYQWELLILRRVTVKRDTSWFQGIQKDLHSFWADVEGARNGTWQPPARVSKKLADTTGSVKESPYSICAIVNDEEPVYAALDTGTFL